jgi:hypothetical protein
MVEAAGAFGFLDDDLNLHILMAIIEGHQLLIEHWGVRGFFPFCIGIEEVGRPELQRDEALNGRGGRGG